MSEKSKAEKSPAEKSTITLPATVEKIIPSVIPGQPDKAQISVEGADHLYKEIRVDNTLHDSNGKPVSLKKGADVEVTIAAEPHATAPPTNGATKKQ